MSRKKVLHSFLRVVVLSLGLVAARSAGAAILFESGTLGPTGVTWDDVINETVGATNIRSVVFTGVRFELFRPVVTAQIGGHFLQRPGSNPNGDGSFFGAVVALDDEDDFPDSADLSTPDVLGSAILSFPEPSNEVFADLSLSLDPGWYALVFGSGLFGATADGVALRNNPDIGEPTYLASQSGAAWFNLSDLSDAIEFVDHRFVVRGIAVPEPTCVIWAVAASLSLLLWRNARQKLR